MYNPYETQDFWGCELNSSSKTGQWEFIQEEGFEHKLIITQITLGIDAKEGERNIIEVETDDGQSYVICSCKLGLNETQNLNLEFTIGATFKLVNGNGPIHIVGSEVTVFDESDNDMSVDDMSDEEISCDDCQTLTNGNQIFEIEPKAENDSEDSDEDYEISDEKINKGSKQEIESSDEEESDEEDGDDEDSDVDDNDEDNDDAEEENDNDSDDNEEESEDEQEKTNQKKKGGIMKSKDSKKPEKRVRFSLDRKSEKSKKSGKANANKVINIEDLTAYKKHLSSSKNVPKNQKKFENYLKSNLKIHNKIVATDLWNWYQKNKLKN